MKANKAAHNITVATDQNGGHNAPASAPHDAANTNIAGDPNRGATGAQGAKGGAL